MGTAISRTKCSQVAGLIQKVGRSSSEASSLCAAVLQAAVFHLKIVAIINVICVYDRFSFCITEIVHTQ